MNTIRHLVTIGASPVAELTEPALALAGASISDHTRRAYGRALARLDRAIAGPLTDTALAEYIASLHAAGNSPSVPGLLVAAVKFRAAVQDQPSPAGPATDRVLAGIRRAGKSRGRGQVAGIGWSQADAMAAVSVSTRPGLAGLRDAAIITVMSDGLLRVSELAALNTDDVRTEPDGSGRLTISSSKTDQTGAGAVLYLGAPTLSRVYAWLQQAGHQSGPLFRRIRRGGHLTDQRLSVRALRDIVKTRAADAGIDGTVSGHSLRIGGAESLAAVGGHAWPLRQGPTGRPRRRGPLPVRRQLIQDVVAYELAADTRFRSAAADW